MLARTGWPQDYQEQFWDVYPRRVAKKAAMKALDRVRKGSEVPFEVLISAVKIYARAVAGKDVQYVAHPATWLNAGRWDDAPEALGGVVSHAGIAVPGMVRVLADTPQWDAWRKFRGKPLPVDRDGGWWCKTEWPSDDF